MFECAQSGPTAALTRFMHVSPTGQLVEESLVEVGDGAVPSWAEALQLLRGEVMGSTSGSDQLSARGWASTVAACRCMVGALGRCLQQPGCTSIGGRPVDAVSAGPVAAGGSPQEGSLHDACTAVLDVCLSPAACGPPPTLNLLELLGPRCLEALMDWNPVPSPPQSCEEVAAVVAAVGPARQALPCVPAFMQPTYWADSRCVTQGGGCGRCVVACVSVLVCV